MKIKKSELKGIINAPSSKSYTHRAIFCSSLAEGKSRIINYLDCEDTREAIVACRAYGISINEVGSDLDIVGTEKWKAPPNPIELAGSATVYRFLLAIAGLAEGKTIIKRLGQLKERPNGEEFIAELKKIGVESNLHNGQVEIFGKGYLDGGKLNLRSDITSQYISGSLIAFPLARNNTEITVTTEPESGDYIEMTLDVLKNFGVNIDSEGLRHFSIAGGQHYTPREYKIEGDFSSTAFLLAGGAINGDIEVRNLNMDSKQGDKEILNILKRMGANIEIMKNMGSVKVKTSDLKGIEIDAKNIPDLVPVCAVLGSLADGETRIINAGRLRIKESDRLKTITEELRKMGADIKESNGGLIIHGKDSLNGATIDSHDDHRIAMSCTIAALSAKGETIIKNADSVKKSYPAFFEDLRKSGANIS